MSTRPNETAGTVVHAPHPPLTEYYGREEDRRAWVGEQFDKTASDYDRIENILGLGTGSSYRRKILEFAGLKPGMRMLDVGMGTGLVAKQAARILGYGDLRIMFTQVLPNILGPLIVIATLGMGGAILAEAALSFLGLGIRPPFPSWGSMLSEARDQIRAAPWLSVFPGLAIFFTVLGLNLLGDGLRDILDPQSQTRRA